MACASARIQKTPHPSAIPTEGRSDEWSDLLYASHAAENRPLGFARVTVN